VVCAAVASCTREDGCLAGWTCTAAGTDRAGVRSAQAPSNSGLEVTGMCLPAASTNAATGSHSTLRVRISIFLDWRVDITLRAASKVGFIVSAESRDMIGVVRVYEDRIQEEHYTDENAIRH